MSKLILIHLANQLAVVPDFQHVTMHCPSRFIIVEVFATHTFSPRLTGAPLQSILA
jgi:hypothetical protein